MIGMGDQGSVLIVGASRGIGLELARQYAADGWAVHATTRSLEEPGTLAEIDGAVQLHALDVRDRDQITALVGSLPKRGLSVVVHNAGIYRGHTRPEIMEVNAKAPIAVVQALIDGNRLVNHGRVVLMTSQMGARRGRTGSLGDYGDSKAALNDEFRLRAPAWKLAGVIGIVMHPGWVRTDMGGSGATLSVEESVAGIRRVIASMSSGDHGRFYSWDGSEHPW
jgi:NAD(P)-dependent dehydrogenase (short-subunit alcohol dehydrogenase family)